MHVTRDVRSGCSLFPMVHDFRGGPDNSDF
jgi:hypothetical protein